MRMQVPDEEVIKIDDTAAKDGTLTSDGCGLIRESYAKKIREILNEGRKNTTDPQTAGMKACHVMNAKFFLHIIFFPLCVACSLPI